jgi:hypothetical protein
MADNTNPAALFEECQKFTQPWLWALILVPFVGVLAVVLLVPKPPGPAGELVLVGVPLILGLSVLTFATACLTTTVTPVELRVRYVPFFVNKRIPIAEIARISPLSYTIWQTGYGIHYCRYGWVYNVSGNEGIQVELLSGKRFLVGTQRPREFTAALQQAGVRPEGT